MKEEKKRNREIVVRIEREKKMKIEKCKIRLKKMEVEGEKMREE
jgi:hypothetical protein